MIILGLSDLHSDGQIPKAAIQKVIEEEAIDIIILAGDLTTYGDSTSVKKVLQEFTIFRKITLYIPGNMDSPDSGNQEFNKIYPLHTKIRSIDGISFIGLGASNPTPFRSPFTLKEEVLKALLEQTVRDWNVEEPLFLVSHTPPLNSDADIVGIGKHVGSSAVREFIEQRNPIAVLCGHIHESRAICKINETICINPGPARHNKGAIIAITKKEHYWTADAKLISF